MAFLSMQAVYQQYLFSHAYSLNKHAKSKGKAPNLSDIGYRSIARTNRNLPNYVDHFSDATKSEALQFKMQALQLQDALSFFKSSSSKESAAMYEIRIQDPSVAQVSYTFERGIHEPSSFTLTIEQLACTQLNKSCLLTDEECSLTPGDYSFLISDQSAEYEFEFQVEPQDTNLGILKKLSHMIQRSGIGIHPDWYKYGSKHALLLESKKTGIPQNRDLQFFIHDNGRIDPKNPLPVLGLAYVARFPQNAILTINEETYEIPENELVLPNGVALSIKSTTDKPISVIVTPKGSLFCHNLQNFFSTYNESIDLFRTHSAGSKGLTLFTNSLVDSVSQEKTALEELGIFTDSEGHLTLSESVLTARYENSEEPSLQFLPIMRMTEQLSKKLDSAVTNPFQHMDSPIASYKNIRRFNFMDPYAASCYAGIYYNNYA